VLHFLGRIIRQIVNPWNAPKSYSISFDWYRKAEMRSEVAPKGQLLVGLVHWQIMRVPSRLKNLAVVYEQRD